MPATTEVRWNDGPLDRAVLSAFVPSARAAQAYAVQTSPAPRIAKAKLKNVAASSLQNAHADLAPTGLGTVFEQGRTGGYPITAKAESGRLRRTRSTRIISNELFASSSGDRYYVPGRTIRGSAKSVLSSQNTHPGGGGLSHPVSGTIIGGAMKADPYIDPAGVFWQRVLFPQFATRTLARAGYAAFKYGSHL